MRIKDPNGIAYIIYAKKKNGESYVTIHYSDISKKHRINTIRDSGIYGYYCIYMMKMNGEIIYIWSAELQPNCAQ